jgi:dynein assembly factor with WDR repeat domains 1
MKLKRFLLRYFPPGVILEYETKGEMRSKDIDLLDLSPECVHKLSQLFSKLRLSLTRNFLWPLPRSTDLDALATVIIRQEPLISESRKPQLRRLLEKLVDKTETREDQRYALFKASAAHILPLTNCAFNKSGDKFITGSYGIMHHLLSFLMICVCKCGVSSVREL